MGQLCSIENDLVIDSMSPHSLVVGKNGDTDITPKEGGFDWIDVDGITIGFRIRTIDLTTGGWYRVYFNYSPTRDVHDQNGEHAEKPLQRHSTAIFCLDPDYSTGKRPCWTIQGSFESDDYGHTIWMEPRDENGYRSDLKLTEATYIGFYVMRAPAYGPTKINKDTKYKYNAGVINKDISLIRLEKLPIHMKIDGINNFYR